MDAGILVGGKTRQRNSNMAVLPRWQAGQAMAETQNSVDEDCFGGTGEDMARHSPNRMASRPKRRKTRHTRSSTILYALLAGSASTATAQSCISLADSTQCSAFNASSISTDSTLVGFFPFLSSVTDVASFDSGIQDYIANRFTSVQYVLCEPTLTDEQLLTGCRYGTLLGCNNIDLDNTTSLYARYTTSVLCNGIVQNSVNPCGLTGDAARPLCASSCADYAQSEQEITASNLCSNPSDNALTQIRADFTNCALPANSLTEQCIAAASNEPDNCGFKQNTGSLCSYCAASSPNATDSCCVFSNSTTRCQGVTLPIVASDALQPVTMTVTSMASATSTSNSSSPVSHSRSGLSGGEIAGVVVGSVLGALLLLGAVIAGCLLFRRNRSSSPPTSIFNQPTASRQQPQMAYNDGARDQERAGLAVMPGGRVARMAALEGSSGEENSPYAAVGDYGKPSMSSEDDTPESRNYALLPPTTATTAGKRSGSLSSGSQFALAGAMDTSPSSGEEQDTSPESRGQSEQLGFFKDYYSQDEIHPSDLVATLWAYEPRAADEFSLERGDMIKVLGIWDDGWATGVRVRQRAEDWRPEDKVQRDSGMSNGSSRPPPPTTEEEGDVKAFPLVCVCLPQHWRKTIEGDSTEGSGAAGFPEMP